MDEAKAKTINLNASDVEACRLCLATEVKLHSLHETHLGTCMESILGSSKSFEGAPNFVCYECAPGLMKLNKLLEKSKRAQDKLLEIYNKNGQISIPLLKEQKNKETKDDAKLRIEVGPSYDYVPDENTEAKDTLGDK